MRPSYILRALSIALLLTIVIIDSLSGLVFKLAMALLAAALLGISFYVGAGENKQKHDAELILVFVFFISLVGLFVVFSSSPTHIIIEPNVINETFTFSDGVNGLNKTISLKNLGNNVANLNISANGNNIKDNNDIRLFANQLNSSIKNISDSASTLGESEIDAKSNKSINTNITYIKKNIDNLAKGPSNPSLIFKNICRAIENITTTINSVDNGSKPLSEATKTLINNIKEKSVSIKSDIVNNGAIFISLSSHLQIERERTEFVSVEIDPSMASRNGEYKGAIIIEANDKKLRKEVPISIKIKGITSGSAESKAKENKSVTFKSMTLNLTGSLGS